MQMRTLYSRDDGPCGERPPAAGYLYAKRGDPVEEIVPALFLSQTPGGVPHTFYDPAVDRVVSQAPESDPSTLFEVREDGGTVDYDTLVRESAKRGIVGCYNANPRTSVCADRQVRFPLSRT
ncbi:MAG: hypothetical protein ABEK12_01170, partial [Candidatus Nanohaloarchaea archaeon]